MRSSFLDLHPEIRNIIYTYLFCPTALSPILLSPTNSVVGPKAECSPIPGIALLQSCRQIYHECVSILYPDNTFVFEDLWLCNTREDHLVRTTAFESTGRWLQSLGSQILLLRRITIKLHADSVSESVLPILKVLWRRDCMPAISLEVYPLYGYPQIQEVNDMFRSLVADPENWKRYLPQMLIIRMEFFQSAVRLRYVLNSEGLELNETSAFDYDCGSQIFSYKPREVPTLTDVIHLHEHRTFWDSAGLDKDGRLNRQALTNLMLVSSRKNFYVRKTIFKRYGKEPERLAKKYIHTLEACVLGRV